MPIVKAAWAKPRPRLMSQLPWLLPAKSIGRRLDPQGNATTSMGVNKSGRMPSSYEVLLGEKRINEAVVWTEIPNFSLVPSSPDLAGAEVELVDMEHREFALRNALGRDVVNYDYILIDCPPSLSLVTINALVAADAVIVPLQCEFLALEGITDLIRNINQIKRKFNPKLELQGVVLTMYDKRNNLSQMVEDDVRNFFGKKYIRQSYRGTYAYRKRLRTVNRF